jgi:glycosyltransferase involved in cell wall biosynthesis
MKVGMLWHGAYPWDVRLEKLITLLLRHGDDVCLVCRGREGLPTQEAQGRLKIFRPSAATPLFFNPVWIYHTLRIMSREQVDLLLVRDLPLALPAGLIGNALGIPVVLDMAENYPAALIAYQNRFYKPFLFRNGWLPKAYERVALRLVTHTFVVAEEQRQRLYHQGVGRHRITLVGNTPELAAFAPNGHTSRHATPGAPSPLTVLYVGKLDAHRGVDLLIRAMSTVVKKFETARLILVGDGTQTTRLQELTGALGLDAVVTFAGWVRFHDIPAYIENSTVCLIPHLKSEHTDTTLPNKLFDYMAFGKPVIASDCTPLKRIVEETGCGLTFRSGDVSDLARALVEVLSDPHRAQKGLNGKQAVMEQYNWERDAGTFLKTIHACAAAP